MQLVLIRHAISEDREEFASTGKIDDLRPLTDEGRKKMKRTARGLSEILDQVDVLATSPLARAVQTAEIVAKEFKRISPLPVDALAPEHAFHEFRDWLIRLDDVDVVAAVGHEPHLSGLASWFLTGDGRGLFELKKGGACALQFPGEITASGARLEWILTPGQLRALG